MKKELRIAIIGGGPGGLTLARILHINGMASSIFERDAGPDSRPQGGTLDLHEESGQFALTCAGLHAEFLEVARYDDQGMRLLDHSGRVLFESADTTSGNRPEVDRTALRDILLHSLPAHYVHWGRELLALHQREDGTWDLEFTDGRIGPYDLVIGADGVWSRVRPLLSHYEPQYSGLTMIEFGIDDIDVSHPTLSRLVGRGKLGVKGLGLSIIAIRNANAHVRAYAIFRVAQGWAAEKFDFSNPAAVREGLLSQFANYEENILDLIRASNDCFATRPIHALPVGHRWQSRRGLTLLGDAAHVMSPFGGEGVNAAMLDATDLAQHLADMDDWESAVQLYEQRMFERIAPVAKMSADAAAVQLSHDDIAHLLKQVREHSALKSE